MSNENDENKVNDDDANNSNETANDETANDETANDETAAYNTVYALGANNLYNVHKLLPVGSRLCNKLYISKRGPQTTWFFYFLFLFVFSFL